MQFHQPCPTGHQPLPEAPWGPMQLPQVPTQGPAHHRPRLGAIRDGSSWMTQASSGRCQGASSLSPLLPLGTWPHAQVVSVWFYWRSMAYFCAEQLSWKHTFVRSLSSFVCAFFCKVLWRPTRTMRLGSCHTFSSMQTMSQYDVSATACMEAHVEAKECC